MYILGGFLIAGILLVAAVGLYGLQATLPSGVHTAAWTIGGMTKSELDAKLQQLDAVLREQPISMQWDNSSPIPIKAGGAGLSLDASELHAALAPVLTGNLFSRAAARWKLRHQSVKLNIVVQRSELDELVEREWADVQNSKPVNAQRIITNHDTVTYVAGRTVQHVDTNALEQQIHSIGIKLLEGALEDMQQMGATQVKAPIRLLLPMQDIAPPVTVETLKKEGIERKIAQFTTSFARSGAGRVHNIQATADTMQDMILKPGDIFDYAAVVERTKQQSGYKQAPIILNGKIVPGVGGGICQVSTTLYNAALRSGLDIVERRNHSLPIRYVPLGQDATFSSGHINFRFRNNTGKHLQIRTAVQGKTITVKLFGSMPHNVHYHIRSKVARTIDPPVKIVRNQHMEPGEERLLQEGKVGYEVVTERIKLVDGKAVATETISTDRYQPKPRLVARHTGAAGDQPPQPTGPKRQIIEDGVSGPLFE